MVAQKKAVVISNCQCLPLASALTTFSENTIYEFFGIHVLPPDRREDAISEFIEMAKSKYDFILAAPLSNDFAGLAQREIENTFSVPVIKISNIYFSGHHPDLTYIGGFNQRVIGPLGDYHSKLCLYLFVNGVNVDDAERYFRNDIYKEAGYFGEYAKSINELIERDIDVDVRASDLLPNLLRSKYCFYSVNHPTSSVIAAYASEILRHLEVKGLDRAARLPLDANMCTDTLASNAVFPIYPEIASHHGVPEFGSYRFKPVGARVNSISLPTFISGEYSVFSSIGLPALNESSFGKNLLTQLAALKAVL